MKEIVIARHGSTPWGTFGHLYVAGEQFATVELPWRGNLRNVSCIPVGTYLIRLGEHVQQDGTRYPCYELQDVPDRSNIEIHIANYATDLLGCIGIGSRFSILNGVPAVASSSAAHARWLEIMNDDVEARLTIHWNPEFDWTGET